MRYWFWTFNLSCARRVRAVKALLPPDTGLLAVTGNAGAVADPAWLTACADFARAEGWGCESLTAGFPNARRLIGLGIPPAWVNLEPSMPSFGHRERDLLADAQLAASWGLGLTLTGQPLFGTRNCPERWNYALAAEYVGLHLQTQTWVDPPEKWAAALALLREQHNKRGLPLPRVQVSVAGNLRNGVPTARAVAAVREAEAAGFSEMVIQWALSEPSQPGDFLRALAGVV